MNYTDGWIVRCPECGALNMIKDTDGSLRKCLVCESTIHPADSIVYKQTDGLIP